MVGAGMNAEKVPTLEEALYDAATPPWGKTLLLGYRDDMKLLHSHLSFHSRIDGALAKVGIACLTALALGLLGLALSGGLPIHL
jgi:hypothetical protein